jgi:BlaI family transcriptional regulator, penicillinase repressor
MKALSQAETELMIHLWELDKAYLKDLIERLPAPKPAYTTVSTLLARMVDKGLVGFENHGRNKYYFPSVKKQAYFKNQFQGIVKTFFNDSSAQFGSFFAQNAKMSEEELKELQKLIDQRLNNLSK